MARLLSLDALVNCQVEPLHKNIQVLGSLVVQAAQATQKPQTRLRDSQRVWRGCNYWPPQCAAAPQRTAHQAWRGGSGSKSFGNTFVCSEAFLI